MPTQYQPRIAGFLGSGCSKETSWLYSLFGAGVPTSFEHPSVRLCAGGPASLAKVGRVVACADARIDNADALTAILGIEPTADPARIIALGWSRWGEDILDRLEGDFAFALWDSGQLFLARDPLGQRPLYVWEHAGAAYFASHPLDMFGAPGFHAAANLERSLSYLALKPQVGDTSFVEGVKRIIPGHLWSSAGYQQRAYWQPRTDPLPLSFEEAVEAVDSELRKAVLAMSRTDRPIIAAHLSGGIDSSAIVATAADELPHMKLIAITGVSSGSKHDMPPTYFSDEATVAAETAERYANVEHVTAIADPECPLMAMDRWLQLTREPILNPWNLHWIEATYRVASERGADVLLEGLLGNFTITNNGLPTLNRLARELRIIKLWREARGYAKFSGSSLKGALWHAFGAMVPDWALGVVNGFRRSAIPPLAPLQFIRHDNPTIRALLPPDTHHRPLTYGGPQMQLNGLRFADQGVVKVAVANNYGTEVRDPAASRRLMELCLRLPDDHYFADGVPRRLGRALVRGRVSPRVYQERRRGFQGSYWPLDNQKTLDGIEEELKKIDSEPLLHEVFDTSRMRSTVPNLNRNSFFTLMRTIMVARYMRLSPQLARSPH